MKIELEKTGRYSFPMGIQDIALTADEQRVYAACLDGVYELSLPARDDHEAKPVPECIGQHASYVSSVALLEQDAEVASTGFDGQLSQLRLLSLQNWLRRDSIETYTPSGRGRWPAPPIGADLHR